MKVKQPGLVPGFFVVKLAAFDLFFSDSDMHSELIDFARRVRDVRRAQPSNLEQALAPEFHRLLDQLLPHVSATPLTIVPEYEKPGIGRPDIALKRGAQSARAFIELKAPTKPSDPARFSGHDKKQFERFQSLPVWALSNFHNLRVFRRSELIAEINVVPASALEPETTDRRAETLIRATDLTGLVNALMPSPLLIRRPQRMQKSLLQT